MAATKDHRSESTWTRRGFRVRSGLSRRSKPCFPCEPTFGCGLFYLYYWQISFTFSPLPFPFNPIVQAVLGLVLLNLVVTLGPRNKLLSPEWLDGFAMCNLGCRRTTERNIHYDFPSSTITSLPIKKWKSKTNHTEPTGLLNHWYSGSVNAFAFRWVRHLA